MRKILEQFFLKRWYSSEPIWYFKPLSWLYGWGTALKRNRYLGSVSNQYKAPVPVLVVGNITAGGTGKTPVVLHLLEELRVMGHNPAVISRGYGRSETANCLVSDDSSYKDVGDEPLLIWRRTSVPVAVGADRQTSIELILAMHPETDIIIADDGLQHYALYRDFEIAVIDSKRGLGNKALLPAGPLREPVDRLDKVDMILLNGDGEAQQYLAQDNCFQFILQGNSLINLMSGEMVLRDSFADKKVHALAGIGNPERFFDALRSSGMEVEEHFIGDHHPVPLSALETMQNKPVIITEKDAVKLRGLRQSNIWYLPVSLKFIDVHGAGPVQQIVSKLNF